MIRNLLVIASTALFIELALFVGTRLERHKWWNYRDRFERRHTKANFSYRGPDGRIVDGFSWVPVSEYKRLTKDG